MIFFYSDPAGAGAWRRQLSTISAAEGTRGNLKFALASMTTFQASLPDLGIDTEESPHTAGTFLVVVSFLSRCTHERLASEPLAALSLW